jgi:hypothetical protein
MCKKVAVDIRPLSIKLQDLIYKETLLRHLLSELSNLSPDIKSVSEIYGQR